MEDLFYDSWLLIGLEEHRYTKPYPTVPFSKPKEIALHAAIKMKPGFWCKYANKLRNNNCYLDFKMSSGNKRTIERMSEARVEAIYNCGKNILIENTDSWAIYDPQKAKKIVENQAWSYNRSSFYCANGKFYSIDRKLEEISESGSLLNRTYIMLASELQFHDVAAIQDNLIIAGFQLNPVPPETGRPFGFLQKIPPDGLAAPHKKTGIREIAHSKIIAFYDETSVMPLYLNDMIVQPLFQRIALFDYDLEVLRVIEREFDPLFISAGLNSTIYMSAFIEGSLMLVAFTPEGYVIFEASIPRSLGELVCPALVSIDDVVYVVGMNGIAAFNQKGLHLWTHFFQRQTDGKVFPLLYNECLTVCFDSKCMAIDSQDKAILEFDLMEGQIRTALIPDASGNYFVGTNKGAYKFY